MVSNPGGICLPGKLARICLPGSFKAAGPWMTHLAPHPHDVTECPAFQPRRFCQNACSLFVPMFSLHGTVIRPSATREKPPI